MIVFHLEAQFEKPKVFSVHNKQGQKEKYL